MTSRQSDAIRTEVMQKLLNALLPPQSYYHWPDGHEAINGVFLESDDTIVLDSFRFAYDGGEEKKHFHRRITVRVEVTERAVTP